MSDKVTKHSEYLTRKKYIDSKLRSAEWSVVPYDSSQPLSEFHRRAIEEYPTENGPADYALCVGSQVLGIVEAKKLNLGPQEVLIQAERYSKGVLESPFNFRGFRVPFLYSTNGEVIWHHDIRHELTRSHQIAQFHTPEALLERLERDRDLALERLINTPNEHSWLRPYQREANEAVEKALAQHKHQMLLAMATGTGKTFTMVNQTYRLMKSGVAKRILFLVDRRALAAQAVRAYASFNAEPGLKFNKIYEVYSQRFQKEDFGEEDKFDPRLLPKGYLKNPQPGHAFVYVSTIQRMTTNLFGRDIIFEVGDEVIDEDAEKEDIPIHAFDLIIADECHRGYTASEVAIWRRTLEHFDAIKIGLTATPAAHTTTFFKEIVYRYEYERAVREGFLVDYDVVSIKSNVRLQGIFLEEGEQVELVDPESGSKQMDLLEDERQFNTSEVEQKVTSPDSNRKILEEVKRYALEHEQEYGRFPKTLVFAVNDLPHMSHADQLTDSARDIFGRGDAFVRKITGRVDRPLQTIREFRNRSKPGVVISVDMLTTGVDIPDLEYIVFLRPVKSRILFEQMLGRGTRKGETYPDKSHFVVFDCFDGTLLEYFRKATGITAEPPLRGLRTIQEIVEDIWRNRDREYNIRCLVKRLQRIEKRMSAEVREMFAAHIPQGDIGRFASELPQKLREDFTGTMGLLRDKGFQDLLVLYPRAPRTFLVAYGYEDGVSSQWLVRDSAGQEHKPADYLKAFEKFVRENPEHIQAFEILQNRPSQWSTDSLVELQQKLSTTSQGFTSENLQTAHKIHYQKALVDIISMVKHAADNGSPLYTAEERVEKAFEAVVTSQTFSEEQAKWLERIKSHLKKNLSIDQNDLETLPVFTRVGGWGRANTVFQGHLSQLLHRFNEAIAA